MLANKKEIGIHLSTYRWSALRRNTYWSLFTIDDENVALSTAPVHTLQQTTFISDSGTGC